MSATEEPFFLGAGSFVGDGTEDIGGLPVEVLANGSPGSFTRNMILPQYFSSIKEAYFCIRRSHAGNLRIRFRTSYSLVLSGAAIAQDQDTYTLYAGGGTDGNMTRITIPTAAYDGLIAMAAGGIFGVTMDWSAEHADNTYESDMQVLGFYIVCNKSGGTSVYTDVPGRMVALSEVKTILQIPTATTTYDAAIASLIPLVQQWVIDKCHNNFEVKRKYPIDYYDQRFTTKNIIFLFTNTIAFVAGTPARITDSDSNFLNAGFRPGFSVKVQDSMYNDRIYGISAVVAGTITLETGETLTDEAAGYYFLLSLVKFPPGLKVPVAKIIGEELKNNSVGAGNIQQESVGNASFTYASIGGEYPEAIIDQLRPFMRPVFI